MTVLQTELQDAAYNGMTAAQALARLNETVVVSTDQTAYTWAGLSDKLTQNGLSLNLVAGLDAIVTALPGGTMLDRMLSSGGVNFASAAIQGQLKALLPSLTGDSATVVQAMIDVGVTYGKRWEGLGITQPTAADVQAAMDANAVQSIIDAARAKVSAIAGWLDVYDTTGKTTAQTQAYVADLFSSPDGNPSGGV